MANQKTDMETLLGVKKAFLEQYPETLIGFLPVKEDKSIRLIVKVKTDEDLEKVPDIFSGYPVQCIKVTEKRFETLKGYEQE